MSLKGVSYLGLWWPFYSAEQNGLCNFDRGHYEKHFCEIILNSEQRFRCRLKDISYLQLCQSFCSMERNHFCNFRRGHYKKQLCKISLNLKQWFRCYLKVFLINSSGGPFVQ